MTLNRVTLPELLGAPIWEEQPKQLVRALPKMAKAAGSDELRQALEDHLEETTNQVQRLEQAFEELDKTAKGKTCKAMKGLIEEGGEVIEEDSQPPGERAYVPAAQAGEREGPARLRNVCAR